jgi:hypothetical protein
MTSPLWIKRSREPKLQGLPERASTRSRCPRQILDHLLAATAGQVDKSYRRAAGVAKTTLEEENGGARVPAHQISIPLATEANQKRTRR